MYLTNYFKIKELQSLDCSSFVVGLSEFESETSCPPDKHANQLRYSPLLRNSISHLKKSCKCFGMEKLI